MPAELAEKVVRLIEDVGLEVAGPGEARSALATAPRGRRRIRRL